MRRLITSPCQTLPDRMVRQSSSYNAAELRPDLRSRGFCPTASSLEYPVNAVNAGFTYSILPLVSVMTMPSATCSTTSSRPARSTVHSGWHTLHLDRRSPLHAYRPNLTAHKAPGRLRRCALRRPFRTLAARQSIPCRIQGEPMGTLKSLE